MGLLAASVSWFVRRLVKRSDDARTENTAAIKNLTDAVNELRVDYKLLEHQIKYRKRRRWL
jgi:hypothetical protein